MADDEEAVLLAIIRQHQEAYQAAIQPYVDRLAHLRSLRPSPLVVPASLIGQGQDADVPHVALPDAVGEVTDE